MQLVFKVTESLCDCPLLLVYFMLALITESSFQIRGSLCGISDEQSGSGAGFSPSGVRLFCHSLFCQCFYSHLLMLVKCVTVLTSQHVIWDLSILFGAHYCLDAWLGSNFWSPLLSGCLVGLKFLVPTAVWMLAWAQILANEFSSIYFV